MCPLDAVLATLGRAFERSGGWSRVKLHWLDGVMLALYLVGMAATGVYFARRNRDTEEYFVGGRSLSGWVIGLSMVGTAISSITFLSMPADSFKTYWLRFLPYAMVPVAALLAAIFFIPFFRDGRVTSAYEYLESRFGPSVRVYGALTYILAQLLRVSLVLYLLALMLHQLTGIDERTCILVCGVFVAAYTVAGGIDAVIWTDVVQTIILASGSLICLGVIVHALPGGLGQIFEVAARHEKFALGYEVGGEVVRMSWGFDLGDKTVPLMLMMSITYFLTEYATAQHFVQRYCAARSTREARKAMLTQVMVGIPTWLFYMFLGTSLFVFFQVFPAPEALEMLDGTRRAEGIVPYFILNHLPVGVAGLVVAAALAAGMSSLDSSINAVSTVGIVDIYRRHWAPGRDDRHYLRVAWGIAALASLSMLAGATWLLEAEGRTLQDTSIKLTSLLGGGLLGIYLLGFFTDRGDARSVWAGIACTFAFTSWTLGAFPERFTVPFDTYYTAAIGNVVMFVVAYGLAGWLPRRERDLTGLTVWQRHPTS
jgi:SSS family solute:Na+ symporter